MAAPATMRAPRPDRPAPEQSQPAARRSRERAQKHVGKNPPRVVRQVGAPDGVLASPCCRPARSARTSPGNAGCPPARTRTPEQPALWLSRRHSCLPRRDSSRRVFAPHLDRCLGEGFAAHPKRVEMSLDGRQESLRHSHDSYPYTTFGLRESTVTHSRVEVEVLHLDGVGRAARRAQRAADARGLVLHHHPAQRIQFLRRRLPTDPRTPPPPRPSRPRPRSECSGPPAGSDSPGTRPRTRCRPRTSKYRRPC